MEKKAILIISIILFSYYNLYSHDLTKEIPDQLLTIDPHNQSIKLKILQNNPELWQYTYKARTHCRDTSCNSMETPSNCISSSTLSSNGNLVAVGKEDGSIEIYQTINQENNRFTLESCYNRPAPAIHTILCDTSPINYLQFSANDNMLIALQKNRLTQFDDNYVLTGEGILSTYCPEDTDNFHPQQISYQSESSIIASFNRNICLLNQDFTLKSSFASATFLKKDRQTLSIGVSYLGHYAAITTECGKLDIWKISEMKKIKTFQLKDNKLPCYCSFSSIDDQLIFFNNRELKLISIKDKITSSNLNFEHMFLSQAK